MYRYTFIFIIGAIIPCCTMPLQKDPQQVHATIIIHGTVGLKANVNLATFIRIIENNLEQSSYKSIVKIIRDDPFFYQFQAMQQVGLCKIAPLACASKSEMASSLFATLIEKISPTKSDDVSLYYTFGWSGLMSVTERYADAQCLYTSVRNEYYRLQKQYPQADITFTIIGYSHGGSLALYLGEIRDTECPGDIFDIDELILIGMPIQIETDYLVQSPIFNKVYHFYSRKDSIQTLDFLSTYKLSRRRFKNKSNLTLPKKLVQVELRIKMPVRNKPCSTKLRVDRSPNHFELWFFGWFPTTSYHKFFPLYPLPTIVFVPALIDHMQRCTPDEHNLVVELRPTQGTATIRKRHHQKPIHCFDWITPESLQHLQQFALDYAPTDVNPKIHHEHVQDAIHSVTCCQCAKMKS